jgi:hypothetical protein
LANVTPDYGARDEVIGYFTVRRKPSREAVGFFSELYREMLAEEKRAGPMHAIAASTQVLEKAIHDQGFDSNETFVFS